MLMLEGYNQRREYERQQQAEQLYLMRYMASSVDRVIQSFQNHPKKVDPMDIWPIPEIDEHIKRQRAEYEEELSKRGDRLIEKYKKRVTPNG